MRRFIGTIGLIVYLSAAAWLGLYLEGRAYAAGSQQQSIAPYPSTAIPETASATGAAAATAVATLAASVGRTTYLSGFCVTTLNPTAVESGVATVTGTITGTLSYQLVEAAATGGQLCVPFNPPVPASGTDVPIVVTLPAISSGAAGSVSAYGFQL